MTAGLFIILALSPSANPQVTLPARAGQLPQATLPQMTRASAPSGFRWVTEAPAPQAQAPKRAKKSAAPCCSSACTCGCNSGEECTCPKSSPAQSAAPQPIPTPWVLPSFPVNPPPQTYYGQAFNQPSFRQFAPSFSGGVSARNCAGGG